MLVIYLDGAHISEVLIKRGKRVCTSRDISGIFKGNYLALISRLINTGWLIPIKGFRGIYYVIDPDEKLKSYRKTDNFQILIIVLSRLFGQDWYFGKTTAASFLGQVHQPVSTYYVLNNKQSRRVNSDITGRIILVKTSAKITGSCGMVTKKYNNEIYRACTKERNLADYLYMHIHGHAGREQFKKMLPECDLEKTRQIVTRCYPKNSAKKMIALLK